MEICALSDRIYFHIGSSPAPKAPGCVRIAMIGDTLGQETPVPNCDIFVHAGNYSAAIGQSDFHIWRPRATFQREMGKMPGYNIIVGGRNDVAEDLVDSDSVQIGKSLYLDGASTMLHGLRICAATVRGTQVKPFHCYNDVVISSIPPFGILDENDLGVHIGSPELRELLDANPPRLCIFSGHPAGHGAMWLGRCLCVNVGIYGRDNSRELVKYGVPLVVDLRPQ